jgi:arabinogalactan endo-1,4-beta-galactosidase
MVRLKQCFLSTLLVFASLCCVNCQDSDEKPSAPSTFYFGADLSYVNQILDHGGVYKDHGTAMGPYAIFKDHGVNLVRFRIWHNPQWTKEVYSPEHSPLYNDINDVEKSISLARAQGFKVLLDFHYSDNWADPGKQGIPKAWENIKELEVLKDSVYQYTLKTLQRLNSKNLLPEFVQLGNEINCGMLYTNAPADFPSCNVCSGNQWQRLGEVLNSAIKAVNDVTATSEIKTEIILHVADPKNVSWWFDNISAQGQVSDFDVVGFSYYPLWHKTIGPEVISQSVSEFRQKYGRKVMILETAYPWTTDHKDNYNNAFGSETPLPNFPFTKTGQRDLLIKLTQEVMDGKGDGIIYWEPAWISVPSLKDQWGTGSSWENNTFFDFEGNTLPSIDFATHKYKR